MKKIFLLSFFLGSALWIGPSKAVDGEDNNSPLLINPAPGNNLKTPTEEERKKIEEEERIKREEEEKKKKEAEGAKKTPGAPNGAQVQKNNKKGSKNSKNGKNKKGKTAKRINKKIHQKLKHIKRKNIKRKPAKNKKRK